MCATCQNVPQYHPRKGAKTFCHCRKVFLRLYNPRKGAKTDLEMILEKHGVYHPRKGAKACILFSNGAW